MGFIKIFKSPITLRLVLPILILSVIGVSTAAVYIPQNIGNNVQANVIDSAAKTVKKFKLLRGYYAQNIIGPVKGSGGAVKPGINHKDNPKFVPLPATLIHDLSALYEKEGMWLELYSAYPFPNRKSRKLDNFQQEAWEFLVRNPEEKFVKIEEVGDQKYLRVAMADTMQKQGCVNCHNSHPDTPKDDWKLGDVRGVLEVKENITPQLASGYALSNTIVSGFIGGSFLLMLSALYAAGSLFKPLNHISQSMKILSEGNMDINIPEKKRKDEIQGMYDSLVIFKDNALEKLRMEKEHHESQKKQEEDQKKALTDMANRFDAQVGEIVESVATAARNMQEMSTQMAGTIEETTKQSESVSLAAQTASGNVQTVAAAAEEMSASIKEIANSVTDTADTAKACASSAQASQDKLDQLQAAVDEIDAVIQAINDVAEQTNLLALNATIEAARAGEAGKGFAVVANEVKSLAGQTHKMTDEISERVTHIKDSASETIVTVNDILKQITSVDEKTTTIAGAIEEQNATTTEISSNVQNAAAGTNEVSNNIQGIQQAANDSASSIEQLKTAADTLSGQAENLKSSVQSFLKEVRSS